jgi:RHS repeat-associated protein
MTATNEYGVLEDRYEYDAFGQPYAGDLESGMNLGYTGKPYDSATGLYNFGYRDYQPVAARFTTVDPIRDGSNWFAYVNNDPVNWIDLWGLSTSDVRNENNILQHTNLSGLERTKAEISDIFGVSFTMGINAGASIKVGGILAIDVGVDLGSNTVTQDKNGLNSIDTIGIDASLNILNFGDIGLQGSKVAPASSSDSFLDHVINAWTNGTSTIAANGNINIKGANLAANGNNLILGVGAQLGVGMEVWVNISESIDAIHYGIQSLQDHIMGKK